jgi:hypothetical protein
MLLIWKSNIFETIFGDNLYTCTDRLSYRTFLSRNVQYPELDPDPCKHLTGTHLGVQKSKYPAEPEHWYQLSCTGRESVWKLRVRIGRLLSERPSFLSSHMCMSSLPARRRIGALPTKNMSICPQIHWDFKRRKRTEKYSDNFNTPSNNLL